MSMTQAEAWPIWVVSLPDAKDRRDMIIAQLEALELPFSFIDAVDGRKGIPPAFEQLIDREGTLARNGYPMSDGEYACALSHQIAYQKILEEGQSGAVILEDDVILTENFRSFYETRSYNYAPLTQLFYYNATVWTFGERAAPAARLKRLATGAWSTAGYCISAEGAAKMRRYSLPLRSRADWPCDTVGLIGHYVTEPRMVLHPEPDDCQSSISSTRQGLIPEGFDFSAGYAKGWRRLFSLASWKRLMTRRFKRRLNPGFVPTAQEKAVNIAGHGQFGRLALMVGCLSVMTLSAAPIHHPQFHTDSDSRRTQ